MGRVLYARRIYIPHIQYAQNATDLGQSTNNTDNGWNQMKINVYEDELYPYYDIGDTGYDNVEIDLPPEIVEWIARVEKEFRKMQDLLRAIYQGNYA